MNHEHSIDIDYPINFQYDENQYIPLETIPETVHLKISGTGWQLLSQILNIRTKPIRYRLENPTSSEGYLLNTDMKEEIGSAFNGLEVRQILTDTLHLSFDKILQNYPLKITVDSLAIPLEEGIRIVSDIQIEPTEIKISGAEKRIKSLQQPYPIEISLDKIKKNYNQNVEVYIDEEGITIQEGKTVKVNFSVANYSERIHNAPIITTNFPQNVQPIEERIKVKYAFKAIELTRIRLADFRIIADFNTFNKSDSTVQLKLLKKPELIEESDISFPPLMKVRYGN